ncbi:MAG: hypothetical protein GX175_06590 [Halanaerobiaceae bacterium]|nr:hypothetical protein [Halanaerobiaceae bacterium]
MPNKKRELAIDELQKITGGFAASAIGDKFLIVTYYGIVRPAYGIVRPLYGIKKSPILAELPGIFPECK